MHDARLGREIAKVERLLRHGEIDNAVAAGEKRERIVADSNA
jgi:hypothetical protein